MWLETSDEARIRKEGIGDCLGYCLGYMEMENYGVSIALGGAGTGTGTGRSGVAGNVFFFTTTRPVWHVYQRRAAA